MGWIHERVRAARIELHLEKTRSHEFCPGGPMGGRKETWNDPAALKGLIRRERKGLSYYILTQVLDLL